MKIPYINLNTGAKIPAVGFGTWQLADGQEAKSSVSAALKTGYRLIDTAMIYRNERSVGAAIQDSGIARSKIFVTTKLWPGDFDDGQAAFEASLQKLGTDYIDLYLIHWPDGDKRKAAWEVLTQLYEAKKARAVGVSNYMVEHLEELFKDPGLISAVNQIEFHPFIYQNQKPVLDLCHKKGIIVEAYSPLTVGRSLNHPGITDVAKQYRRSNAQVILRWCLQHGTVPIPRSTNPGHIKENLDIFNFEISDEHMAAIDNLSRDSGWHPNQM